jgi:hypothetical protein
MCHGRFDLDAGMTGAGLQYWNSARPHALPAAAECRPHVSSGGVTVARVCRRIAFRPGRRCCTDRGSLGRTGGSFYMRGVRAGCA